MSSSPNPTTVDCRGMQCPAPIIATAKAAKMLRSTGGVLQVLADDDAFPLDVQSWCRSSKATILSFEDGTDGYQAMIRIAPQAVGVKGRSAGMPAPSAVAPKVPLIDCIGQQCPKPILALSKHARKAPPGSELEVVADDDAFPTDLRSWARTTGAEVLSFQDASPPYRARLRLKGIARTPRPEPQKVRERKSVVTRTHQMSTASQPPVSAVSAVSAPAVPVADHIRIDVSYYEPTQRLSEIVQAVRSASASMVTVVAPDPSFSPVLLQWCTAEGHTLRSLNGSGPVMAEIAINTKDLGRSSANGSGASLALAPQAPVTALALPEANNCALLVLHNDHEALLAALLIANGAASAGMDVTMFFTFWGLNLLRGDRPNAGQPKEKVSLIQRLFKWMMPKGAKRQALGQMNFGGVGRGMLDSIMKGQNIMMLPELVDSAQSQGVKFIACTMSMSVMGITKRDLHPYEHLEYGGVAAFVEAAKGAGLHMTF